MTVRIDKRLHLVIPIYDDDEKKPKIVAYAHATPLLADQVDKNFMLLGQTVAAITSNGLGYAGGLGNAARLLKQIAENTGVWRNQDGTPGSGQFLMEEIRRLTNIIAASEPGKPWEQIPIAAAEARGFISEEDRREVENAVVFFICSYAALPRSQRRPMLTAAADLWGALLSSSSCTEFIDSLKTSKETASSGERSPAPAKQKSASATATVGGKPASVPR